MYFLHRQLDVELNAVEDILEVGLLVHIKLKAKIQCRFGFEQLFKSKRNVLNLIGITSHVLDQLFLTGFP